MTLGDDERTILTEEARETSRQILTLVGLVVGLFLVTVAPSAKRDLALIDSLKVAAPGLDVAFVMTLLTIAAFACACWYIVTNDVFVRLFDVNKDRATYISLEDLRKGLRSAYCARTMMVILLFSLPIGLLMNFLVTARACIGSPLCN